MPQTHCCASDRPPFQAACTLLRQTLSDGTAASSLTTGDFSSVLLYELRTLFVDSCISNGQGSNREIFINQATIDSNSRGLAVYDNSCVRATPSRIQNV